jgi:arylsulfatase A-like enzyme
MPEILKNKGIHTHIASDHQHYWEDGGCTYHTRYNTWEFNRGQEGDPWKAEVGSRNQDKVNRKYMTREQNQPQANTFKGGLEFLEKNHDADNWFLTIETFDPHEPFFTQQKYKDLYPHKYDGPLFDWPKYGKVTETREQIEHMRYEYAALLSMCDEYLGKVLDAMDKYDLWRDTMLIVNTDHGFLLSEHDFWAKVVMPFYNEIIHTPFFIWDPRCGKNDERRQSLVQTIDIAPTLLEYFGLDIPGDMQGLPLKDTASSDNKVRDAALFGLFGGHVNCTDGRYVYMRGHANPDNTPLYDYTLMPTHMRSRFAVNELKTAEMAPPFSFTKGCPVMKIKGRNRFGRIHDFNTMLFDLKDDPGQKKPIKDKKIETMMTDYMVDLMKKNDSPSEQFERLGL